MSNKTNTTMKQLNALKDKFFQLERRYLAFMDNTSEGIWCFEAAEPIPVNLPEDEIVRRIYATGFLVECNDAMAKMYGFDKKEDLIGARLEDILVSSDERNIEYLKSFIRSGFRLVDGESHKPDTHGNSKIYLNNFTGIIENNRLVQAWGTQRDITEQKRSEEQIKSLTVQLEQFSQISADIITIKNNEEQFQKISDAVVEISDYNRLLLYTFKDDPPYRDIIGHKGVDDNTLKRLKQTYITKDHIVKLFSQGVKLGNQSCYIPHTMKHILDQSAVDYGKKEYSPGKGRWQREDNLFIALKDNSGDLIGMISIDDSKSGLKPSDETVKPLELFANHISQILQMKKIENERREIEQKFQQAEKIRALGEMSGGVAHNFNNVLSAILGRAQLLKRDITAPDILHGLEVIEKAALDGAATIKRIQEFTRVRTDQKFDTIDINETIRDSIKFTRTRWQDEANEKGLKINITTKFNQDPQVKANASEMREVFTNLILNAVEAMPESGNITIISDIISDHVKITIQDEGTGMDEEILKRVFDPFFTTRGVKGTGLGLSVTYGIIHRHNGEISIQSEPGVGTTITINLPLSPAQMATPAPQVEKAPAAKELETAKILVVD
ncbi:MAG: PAS domain-containing protein, partial [Candidatus Marinimicrobia bacterium]|nr:PAS domain-containing protein [Candidatus Neomarinimicrobiota bacterium]